MSHDQNKEEMPCMVRARQQEIWHSKGHQNDLLPQSADGFIAILVLPHDLGDSEFKVLLLHV